MNFNKMVKDAKIDQPITLEINSFMVKNKGSIMKISEFYQNFYNDLIEKWGIKCVETSFTYKEIDQNVKAMLWNWEGYLGIDTFSRVKFLLKVNAFRISKDTVMGIFSIKYVLEMDYKSIWRKSSFTNWYLPIYLRNYYNKKLLSWVERYMDDLNSIKEKLMERLNMSTYD
ncbi:MAG: hypothetical protein PHT91_01280 [Candidatus Nanoarchaeia archaeon]|nr:hypothetical protein [Candidatus Nanoarchaeia archaeon]MDD5054110.1 hypothetical protein [Candidatus Nanoarchaeia archaeon]MDD5499490.1 hypothetical protein [Candidatus Nanoarchaeia archaeon]